MKEQLEHSVEWPGRMNNKDAQEEANMLQVKLRKWASRELTAKDYDQALEAVEEMKRLAEAEPASLALLNSLVRIAEKAGFGLMMALGSIGNPHGALAANQWKEEAIKKFEDAKFRLKELKKDAKWHGKLQTEAMTKRRENEEDL